MNTGNASYVLSHPSEVGIDHLIVALGVLSPQIEPPPWSFKLWKSLDTGDCRTWEELGKALYTEKEFGKKVKEFQKVADEIFKDLVIPNEYEEEIKKKLEKFRMEKLRQEKMRYLAELQQLILKEGVDPEEIVSHMKSYGAGESEEEKLFLDQILALKRPLQAGEEATQDQV